MITDDLIAYIQAQLRKKISKDIIISRLLGVGWHSDDVDEAFRKLTPPQVPIVTQNIMQPEVKQEEKKPDLYRELPTLNTGEIETAKPLTPLPVSPQSESAVKPIFATSFSEANPKIPVTSYYIPNNSSFKESPKKEIHTEAPLNFGVMNPKVVHVSPQKTETLLPQLPTTPVVTPAVFPTVVSSSLQIIQAPEFKLEAQKQEFIPTLKPKITLQVPAPETITPKSVIEPPIKIKLPSGFVTTTSQVVKAFNAVPENAILYSYPKILLSSEKQDEIIHKEVSKNTKKKLLKWLLIILIVSFIGGIIFAFATKYIQLPRFNTSFIKKDPKALLVNAPIILGKLKSYKVETNATISFPSIANITLGLLNGQATQSKDKDFVTLSAKGLIDNTNQPVPTFDYLATLKSSLFKNDIISTIKYSNTMAYITIPSLIEFLGPNAPGESNVILAKGQQFSPVVDLLPAIIKDKLKKINVDTVITTILPSYVTTETNAIFAEFATRASVTEKDFESIKGMPTYHYVLSADREATKKFLNQFVTFFVVGLSDGEKSTLSESLGAATLDTFEVWVGKDDSTIHQYKFTLTIPLSKVIGLEDKGIAGNVVSLEWKTTYYDFDLPNIISMPTSSISMANFIKSITDMKIKDLVSTFKPLASTFRNATGTYGKRSNPTGSCTNPNPSSLFSPVGHAKGANTAVGNIARSMKDILDLTNGALSCYSTSNDWALSAPLASDPTTAYCVDSTGTIKILTTQLKGTVCK